jgi:branched-chain amino acid transport system permease protein
VTTKTSDTPIWGSDVDKFIFLTVDGLTRGAVYAAFALSLVLIWRGTRIVNFAQGAFAVGSAYVAFSVTSSTGSYWLGFLAALVSGLIIGALLERFVMRPVEQAPPLNPVIVALGLVFIIQAAVGMIYGNDFKPTPTPFSREALIVGGIPLVSNFDLFVFAAVVLVMVLLGVLFTRTPIGLRMRSAAFAPEVSRLLGVNVGRMLTLGWALAAAVGAMAALLVTPTELGLHPTAMDLVFIYSFTAAVVGGLDSPQGAVVGGLGVGLVLSYVSGYVGADITPAAVLAVLVLILLVRPGGLFTRVRARQV